MSVISIGIQTIMPKTGTSPQTNPPRPANDRDADNERPEPKPAPPPHGMGRFVDKSV
jgi:hypothetical protein